MRGLARYGMCFAPQPVTVETPGEEEMAVPVCTRWELKCEKLINMAAGL